MMDRPLPKSSFLRKRRRLLLGGISALLVLAVALLQVGAGRAARLRREDLAIAQAVPGVLHDAIPLRARVVPRDTLFVDAVDGGRVEQVTANPGDIVTKGQPLVSFSNTQLELQVLEKEGQLIQSIAVQETYQTELEQNRLNNESTLALIDWNITRLARSLPRRQYLVAKGVESQATGEEVEDELAYWKRRRPLQEESNRRQEEIRQRQLPQIDGQLATLQQDLKITRAKLDSLLVRAPADGRVTAIDLKVGQILGSGNRIAEITPDTGYKLSQEVDEFYLARLHVGQHASVEIDSRRAALTVSRIYPQIKNGTFTVDLSFDGPAPAGLLPGQTVLGRLTLGEDTETLVAPSGSYLLASGGRWVFALSPDGHSAVRRSVTLGRRTAEQVEVLEGLKSGESFVASDYRGLDRVERIDIQD